jgi:hypothetical protein
MDPVRARSWWRVLDAVPGSSIMFVKYLYWKTAQPSILSDAEQHNISRHRVAFVDKLPSFHLHLQVFCSDMCPLPLCNIFLQRVRQCAVFLDCDKCGCQFRLRPIAQTHAFADTTP